MNYAGHLSETPERIQSTIPGIYSVLGFGRISSPNTILKMLNLTHKLPIAVVSKHNKIYSNL